MADPPRTRQELYERIAESSKDEVVLDEMIRLGFWPREGRIPEDPAAEIRRRGELNRELERLREQNRHLYNEQALIKELRQRRLAESKRKQAETKARRERERLERAAAWREEKKRRIVYLGEGVSAGLGQVEGNVERLRAAGLPIFHSALELANAMGLSVGALRFLCFTRKTATISHYVRFRIPKKTGGERLISAPLPRLKKAQAWVLHEILQKLSLHDAAHGFARGRSIVSNARPHVGHALLINVDLKDFFPTVGYPRVKGLYRSLGYSEEVATLLGLLCTEPDVQELVLDGRTYYVASGPRHLPQGAPTSPAITNLLCRRLDRRLQAMADELGFVYTRYADDLTFSAKTEDVGQAAEVLRRLERIVGHEGFVIHPDKTRVLRRGRRQEVTGVVVNHKPGVPHDVLHRFRATLFQIEKDGPAGKRWGASKNVLASIRGFASYVRMVDPARGAPLCARVAAIVEKHGGKPGGKPRPPGSGTPPAAPSGSSVGGAGAAAAPAASSHVTHASAAVTRAAEPPAAAVETDAATSPSGEGSSPSPAAGPGNSGGKKWWKVF
jgi:hypothetical protein